MASVQFVNSKQSSGKKSAELILIVFIISLLQLSTFAQTGVYTLNSGSASQTGQTYSATQTDQSAILVTSSAQLTLTNCIMNKTGDATDVNAASQYGTNAGVLTKSAGKVIIIGGSVTTSAKGANALFATGTSSAISMSNGTITASGANAHGVDATYGGAIVLNNVNVSTDGANASALATDFGGGTVTVSGGTIIASAAASGSHSAGIYSTGVITVSDATVTSSGDCGGVIDGANSIILNNTVLNGKVEGIKAWKTAPASGAAAITINGGALNVSAGDGFYITGETGNAANAVITVKAGAKIYSGTGNILNAVSSSTAVFNIDADTLSGNLVTTGTGGTITAVLKNNSRLTGKINTASLTLDASSSWVLTGNSVLTSLINPYGISSLNITNITGNGYSVHYDATLAANSYLGGKIYNLVNGGYLTPNAVGIQEHTVSAPEDFDLQQNYPNPFNPSTKIGFTINKAGFVNMEIYNAAGKKITTLLNQNMPAGNNSVTWNGKDDKSQTAPAGVYFYRLSSSGQTKVKKLILLK